MARSRNGAALPLRFLAGFLPPSMAHSPLYSTQSAVECSRIWYDVCVEPESVDEHSLHVRGTSGDTYDSIVVSRFCIEVHHSVPKLINADAEATENPF